MITSEKDGFQLHYGSLRLYFRVETRARKSLSITVHPDRTLQVLAPPEADLETVLARVDHRAAWIARQWRSFSTSNAGTKAEVPHEYLSGETHWYLGRALRLRLGVLEMGEAASIHLHGNFLHIAAPEPPDSTTIARLLEAWYRRQARQVLQKCLSGARSLQIEATPPIEIRKMQKRWGSCTRSGKILLNLDLVKMPVDCIEYVLFHELCHLEQAHHGPQFYALLGRFIPDWKARKAKLEEWGLKI